MNRILPAARRPRKLAVVEAHGHFSSIGHAGLREEVGKAVFFLLLVQLGTVVGVDTALVAAQAGTLSKAHSTNFADMRLLTRVGAHVHDQDATLNTAHPTNFANMRPLIRVDSAIVGDEAAPEPEASPTNFADMGLLTRVDALVHSH